MYSARKFDGESVEQNIYLGESYDVIHKSQSPHAFEKQYKATFHKVPGEDSMIEAFIVSETKTIPLYGIDVFYIVSANGQTFSKVKGRK